MNLNRSFILHKLYFTTFSYYYNTFAELSWACSLWLKARSSTTAPRASLILRWFRSPESVWRKPAVITETAPRCWRSTWFLFQTLWCHTALRRSLTSPIILHLWPTVLLRNLLPYPITFKITVHETSQSLSTESDMCGLTWHSYYITVKRDAHIGYLAILETFHLSVSVHISYKIV